MWTVVLAPPLWTYCVTVELSRGIPLLFVFLCLLTCELGKRWERTELAVKYQQRGL